MADPLKELRSKPCIARLTLHFFVPLANSYTPPPHPKRKKYETCKVSSITESVNLRNDRNEYTVSTMIGMLSMKKHSPSPLSCCAPPNSALADWGSLKISITPFQSKHRLERNLYCLCFIACLNRFMSCVLQGFKATPFCTCVVNGMP